MGEIILINAFFIAQNLGAAALFGLPGGSGQAPGWVSGCGWQGRGGGSGWGKPWSLGGNYSQIPVPFPAPPRQHLLQKQEIAYY